MNRIDPMTTNTDERVQARLAELRSEYEKGRQTLEDLEAQTTSVRSMLLRIAGAIQVLEEISAPPPADPSSADAPQPNGQAPAPAPAA